MGGCRVKAGVAYEYAQNLFSVYRYNPFYVGDAIREGLISHQQFIRKLEYLGFVEFAGIKKNGTKAWRIKSSLNDSFFGVEK
jgi:hypothetical protein